MSWLDTNQSGGIGRADIDRALASGRSQAEIQSELNRAKSAGIQVGQKASSWAAPYHQKFDLQEAVSVNRDYADQITALEDFNKQNYGSFGASALERARASGMSDSDIRAGIEKGRYKIGQKAYDSLYSSRPSPVGGGIGVPYRNKYGGINFVSGKYGDQGRVEEWDPARLQDYFGSKEPPAPGRSEDPDVQAVEAAYNRNKISSYLKWLNEEKGNPQRFLERYLNVGFE